MEKIFQNEFQFTFSQKQEYPFMNKYFVRIICFLSILITANVVYAQTGDRVVQTKDGPVKISWQAPLTAWLPTWIGHVVTQSGSIGAHKGIDLYWEKSQCNRDGDIVGPPRVAIKNEDPSITIHDVYVTVAGIECDGKDKTRVFCSHEITPYEFKMEHLWDTHSFRIITKVISVNFSYTAGDAQYYVEYDAAKGVNKILIDGKDQDEWLKEKQEKEQEAKQQFDDVQKQFNNKVKTYNQTLNNIKDASVRSKYLVLRGVSVAHLEVRIK